MRLDILIGIDLALLSQDQCQLKMTENCLTWEKFTLCNLEYKCDLQALGYSAHWDWHRADKKTVDLRLSASNVACEISRDSTYAHNAIVRCVCFVS